MTARRPSKQGRFLGKSSDEKNVGYMYCVVLCCTVLCCVVLCCVVLRCVAFIHCFHLIHCFILE